jgi:hypothetical protein
MASMLFKRNQLEDAISSLVEPKVRRPSAGLRTRLKRLLETDRALGRSPRSSDPELANYAFFSAGPPGRGVEVQFSEYEGFAILTALQMMQHSWTQNVAVSILRRARSELELHHARILKLRRDNKASELTFENDIPILVIITSAGTTPDIEYEAFACAVREGYRKAIQWTWDNSKSGHGFSMFELVTNAQKLTAVLARTERRHRGQPG